MRKLIIASIVLCSGLLTYILSETSPTKIADKPQKFYTVLAHYYDYGYTSKYLQSLKDKALPNESYQKLKELIEREQYFFERTKKDYQNIINSQDNSKAFLNRVALAEADIMQSVKQYADSLKPLLSKSDQSQLNRKLIPFLERKISLLDILENQYLILLL